MELGSIAEKAGILSEYLTKLAEESKTLEKLARQAADASTSAPSDAFIVGLTVFILACFVGYYVVWKVTPALHSPLMAVTNAISSVIIVGALLAAGPDIQNVSIWFGMIAIMLASVNIFGGFIVTQRMLQMFSKSK
jgi:NAD(P) transhydrogenase subunit alpha